MTICYRFIVFFSSFFHHFASSSCFFLTLSIFPILILSRKTFVRVVTIPAQPETKPFFYNSDTPLFNLNCYISDLTIHSIVTSFKSYFLHFRSNRKHSFTRLLLQYFFKLYLFIYLFEPEIDRNPKPPLPYFKLNI